jgi:hypothetical protein
MAWRQAREANRTGAHRGAMTAVCAACAAIGLVTGSGLALGAFYYDGTGRVNVLLLLALFAALPLATLVLALTGAAWRGPPGGLSPGRLGAALARLLPAGGARGLGLLASGARGPAVAKWLLLSWSQWLGLGFGLGALATAFSLVLFTDLAFGWSTTLDVAPAAVQRLCEAVAVPWRALLPAAAPDRELIEATRYFRVAAAPPPEDPALPGRWWPFVLLAMLVYGVLPRAVALLFAHARLSRSCAAALLADPRVHALLDRMNTPLVETRSPEAESPLPHTPAPAAWAELPQAQRWHVIDWAEVALDDDRLRALLRGATLVGVDAAGGARHIDDDRALANRLGAAADGAGILVIARGFEPPTLELMDFLGELRAAASPETVVATLPVDGVDGVPRVPSEAHAAAWRQALARSRLEGVRLVRMRREDAP